MIHRDIEKLWNTYEGLIKRLCDDSLNQLVDELGQRIAECSVTQKLSEPFCGPGGLLDMSLQVASTSRTIAKSLEIDVNVKSILLTSLTCDIGMIGTLEKERYSDQTSDWHVSKLGQVYIWNEECPKVSTSDQTLFLLQHYGAKLSFDEWIAIKMGQGPHLDENKFYAKDTPELAYILQSAKYAVYQKEKRRLIPDVIPF